MNGVHDMGGMHGLGPIDHEENEPVFHEPWEGRMYAINRSLTAFGRWNIDQWRSDIEQLAPSEYLRMSYYEKWLAAMEQRVVRYGFVTQQEFESGRAADAAKATPALGMPLKDVCNRKIPSAKDASIAPLFQVGEKVRAKNMHPPSHTRLPRYARGKVGEILRDHGVYSFPDTCALGLGDKRQHLYSVRFSARELWGPEASAKDCVQIDLWDDYLEHA